MKKKNQLLTCHTFVRLFVTVAGFVTILMKNPLF